LSSPGTALMEDQEERMSVRRDCISVASSPRPSPPEEARERAGAGGAVGFGSVGAVFISELSFWVGRGTRSGRFLV
jgi:hypothetical protein